MIEWGQAVADTREQHGSLSERFVVPPFSVLDTRQGYWQERRRAWLALGIKGEEGRGLEAVGTLPQNPSAGERNRQIAAARARVSPGRSQMMAMSGERDENGHFLRGRVHAFTEEDSISAGASIFDPVLTELAYRWFAPERGHILDPFAGGSVRGVVAAYLGHPYTGIDLSHSQLVANREQAKQILPEERPAPSWHQGDSREMDSLLPAGQVYDLVFSCPPYFDLEVYSDHPADLSAMGSYSEFLDGYGQVIEQAAERLRPERFMVLVVSEIRDKDGYCRGFVADTIRLALAAGLRLYNEAVLINSAGSLPMRAGKFMEAGRKLGRSHQNVLVFAKGKPQRGWSYEREAPPDPQLSLFPE